MRSWILMAILLLGLGFQPARADEFADRVLRNYNAVINGTKKISDLPASEQTELMYFIRFMNEDEGPSECRDAKRDARDAAEELASAARNLAYCADQNDSADDCEIQFLEVSSAHSDYESAVSDVDDECDD